ncbi:MAG: sugar transferase [Bacteroidales bacterium]|jgi:lipopolysaccharide/colanic/teichoic acid biosynthesis glycosyltransferase
MIRFFDLVFSFLGLIILFPFFLIIGIVIFINSKGGIFFLQNRVGRNNRDFLLIKFRTMHIGADKLGGLTIGNHDQRITSVGYFLRKHKLDELPQLFNVLKGEMSIVGPRPELRKYVELYSADQKKVLDVRPGITDIASLDYINENEILGTSSDPEKTYIEQIMPAKLLLNKKFLENRSARNYFRIIKLTLKKIIG